MSDVRSEKCGSGEQWEGHRSGGTNADKLPFSRTIHFWVSSNLGAASLKKRQKRCASAALRQWDASLSDVRKAGNGSDRRNISMIIVSWRSDQRFVLRMQKYIFDLEVWSWSVESSYCLGRWSDSYSAEHALQFLMKQSSPGHNNNAYLLVLVLSS